MRKLIIFLVVLSACHKTQNESENSAAVKNSIVGTWELARDEGGNLGIIQYPPGNGNTISFFEAGSFRMDSKQATIIPTGTYYVIRTGAPNGKNILIRKYDSLAQTDTDSLLISNDVLTLSRPYECCDAPYIWTYNKIPDKK